MRALAPLLFGVAAAAVNAPLIAAATPLSAADSAAVFEAAGFARQGGEWRSDCGDPSGGPYEPGRIESVRDLNGDGLPEALIVEGGSFCYGAAGTGFILMSKQPGGGWKRITADTGIAEFLPMRGVAGWPDLRIGGPGFCFPVQRWNGRAYVVHRFEYEGRPCRRPR